MKQGKWWNQFIAALMSALLIAGSFAGPVFGAEMAGGVVEEPSGIEEVSPESLKADESEVVDSSEEVIIEEESAEEDEPTIDKTDVDDDRFPVGEEQELEEPENKEDTEAVVEDAHDIEPETVIDQEIEEPADATSETLNENASEASTELETENAAEAVSEEEADDATEAVSEEEAEDAAEAVLEEEAEAAAEAASETLDENASKAVTDQETENTTEAVSEEEATGQPGETIEVAPEVVAGTEFYVEAYQTSEFYTVLSPIVLTVNAYCDDPDAVTYAWYDYHDELLEEEISNSIIVTPAEIGSFNYYCYATYGEKTERADFQFDTQDYLKVSQNAYKFNVSYGDNVTLKVNTECFDASDVTYEWSFNYGASETGTDTKTITAEESGTYYCTIKKQSPGCSERVSFLICIDDFIVYPEGVHKNIKGIMPQEITINPETPPESLTLRAVVRPEGKQGLEYNWFRNEGWIYGGTDTLTLNPFQVGEYKCEVRDQYGNSSTARFNVVYDTGLTLLPEGSGSVNGEREHFIDIKTQFGVSNTLNTELFVKEGTEVTYQWYVWYPETGWEPKSGNTESSLLVKSLVDSAATDRYKCKVTDQYGNIDAAFFHLSEVVNSITSPNGYLNYSDGNEYYIRLPMHYVEGHYEPVSFEVDVDADDTFQMIYECFPDNPYVDPGEVVNMVGTTAIIKKPGDYWYYVYEPDGQYVYNDRVAEILIDVYDPELAKLNIYPEGAETVDGVIQDSVSKTIEPGEKVSFTVISEDNNLKLYYWWQDPKGDNLSQARNDSSLEFIPETSGLYKCDVSTSDGRKKPLYYYIKIENDLHAFPAGIEGDPDNYDAERNLLLIHAVDGESITLNAEVTAENIRGMTYDWKTHDPDDKDLETGWKEVPDGSTASILVTPTKDTLYECEVTDAYNNTIAVSYLVTFPKTKDLGEATVSLSSSSYIYSGAVAKPSVTVVCDGIELTEDKDYVVTYSSSDLISIGTKTVTITGIGDFIGMVTKNYKITPAPISQVTVTGLTAKTYTGNALTQTPKVMLGSTTLKLNTDYTVSYLNNINAGTATVKITGKGNYTGTITATFKINKAAQSITAKSTAASVAVGKTATVSITGAKGTKSYKSSDTAIATVTSTGKVTAKKVGTVTITATSGATTNYKAASKTVTIKVVPAATTSLTAANQATGIKLTWKKVIGANGYKVYRGSTLLKTITSGSTVTYTDTKANTNGTKYTFKIVAKAATGDSTLSKSLGTYRVARPAISSATNSAAGKMTVKWAKNAKATGYQIQYSTSSTFASVNKAVSVTSATTVSKVITGLTKGKTYYVRMRTYKTVGSTKYWSAWSVAKTVKITK